MDINTGKGFSRLGNLVGSLIEKDAGMNAALNGCSLDIGMSGDAKFGVPPHAADSAIFMGDSVHVGEQIVSPAAQAAMKAMPDKVQVRPRYDAKTGKFNMQYAIAGDAGFDPLAGQLFSPWNIAYLSKVWKEPLGYSRAHEMIRREHASNNPFAEIFTLFLEEYAGWGVIGQTGDLQNVTTNDVNVQNGMASFPIINMMGTYSLTLEEKKRSSWGPLGSSPLSRKQSYLNYVMNMMDDILIYWGNEETHTQGLFDINPIKTWDTGASMKDIFYGTSTTRGSDAFRKLAGKLNDFLTRADNKFNKIKIAISPEAYNYLTTMPYSDQYDATVAMKTFAESYCAGKGPNHSTPSIEFVADPMLKAKSIFNPNPFDYMVITAPEVGGGPENERQATNFYAVALDKFVFPVIPGMYNDQYKTLRRVAGVVAPIPAAVEVWAGFGVQG